MRPAFRATLLILPLLAACSSESSRADSPVGEAATATDAGSGDAAMQAVDPGQASAASTAAAAGGNDDAIMQAAGFTRTARGWEKCEDPGSIAYAPGEVGERGDFNGDGRPDAIVNEGSTACAGMTGNIYTLVSQQADGRWKIIDERIGLASFLATKGADGWPDIEVGAPGFCFAVLRFDGDSYELNRSEYEGKPCQPG